MIFPPELDNKPFRLFIQRIYNAKVQRSRMSPIEKSLAHLIDEHSEVNLPVENKQILIDRQFSHRDFNPFIYLGALYEIDKQVSTNHPRGIAQIAKDLQKRGMIKKRIYSKLANLYLFLYRKNIEEKSSISATQYLNAMRKLTEESLSEEEVTEIKVRNNPNPD